MTVRDAARSASAAANAVRVAGAFADVYSLLGPSLYGATSAVATMAECRSDYKKLLKVSGDAAGELGEPIDLESLGPLWPDGEPKSFNEPNEEEDYALAERIRNANPAPLIEVCFDDSGFSDEEIALFLEYLAETYRSVGGKGLKIVEGDSLVLEEELV